MHVPSEQQPAQLSGLQVLTHWPPPEDVATHAAPARQVPQSPPWFPHTAEDVPSSQMSPLQHPTHAPHFDDGTHAPLASHVYPAGHVHEGATWQTPPPPSGDVAQTAGVPAFVQSAQALPPPPHVCASVPV
jgi:hypothetical protein